ncbi:MAG: terminase small subunit [Candidatus Saccharibacteria bacterium]|nr:terminase small subunit [Rhodoferax sp.]
MRWIDEYLVDFNGSAAAVRAGYSEKSARAIACENLTKPDIQAVLQARQAEMAKELQITRQGVIRALLDAFEMSRKQQNPSAMVTALREVSKMLGFNAPEVKRVELTATQHGAHQDLSSWSDAQLLEAIAASGTKGQVNA